MDDPLFFFFFFLSFRCRLFSCVVAVSDRRATWLLIYPLISIHSLIKAYIINAALFFVYTFPPQSHYS